MNEKGNHPVIAVQVGGHGQNQDEYRIGMSKFRIMGTEGQNVLPNDLYFNTSISPADQQSKDTYGGTIDPGTPVLVQPSYPGSPNFTVIGAIRGFPKIGTPMPGNSELFRKFITGPNSENPWDQAINIFAKPPLKTENRGGKIVKVANAAQDFIPSSLNFKPHFGETFEEIGRRWEQFKNVPTAETPFSNIINSNMMSQLPGKVLSFASAFKSLTSQQKQRIQSSVPPEIYNMIEANLSSTMDEPTESDIGFNNRVHEQTFANNMVDLLCQCTTYADIVAVKQRMYYDRELHGLDQLPEIEFRVNTGFGEVGIIVDADGELRENVSSDVVASQQEFFNFLVGPENAYDDTAQFYGTIKNNILTVNRMLYGNVVSGVENLLVGDNIPDSTYITRFQTGRGNTGTYIINTSTQTTPNTIITIISKQEQPQTASSSKNGGGGFPGMASGANFFGEASKLVGEILPVLNPKGQAKIKSLLESITNQGGGPNKIIGQNDLVKGKIHAFEIGKFIKGL